MNGTFAFINALRQQGVKECQSQRREAMKSLAQGALWWEVSHMVTLVTADNKRRVCIRGAKRGEKYLVKEVDGGWWITPVPKASPQRPASRNRRKWAGSKQSLDEHLQALADLGLRIEEAENAKEPVPPCPF